MKPKKVRSYLALAAISVVLVVVVSAASQAFSKLEFSYPATPLSQLIESRAQMSSEELGTSCQPEGATNRVLIAEATSEHSIYQTWRMTIDDRLVARTTTLFGTVCGLANDSRYMQVAYENVPEDIAKALALQELNYNIAAAGGLEAYRAQLIEHLQPDGLSGDTLPQVSSIDVQAWQAVGLSVPAELFEVIEYQETKPYGS